MRKKNLPLITDMEITDAGAEGMAVGRWNEMVVFVPWAVPGDVVNVQVIRRRKKYMDARLLEVVRPSPRRIRPYCSHFGLCGGCRWQNMDYPSQLHFKAKWVNDALRRLGKFAMPEPLPIAEAKETRFYRNKLEYTFSNRRYLMAGENIDDPAVIPQGLGFHLPGRFDRILGIETCYHQPEPSNAIRLWLRDFSLQQGFVFQDLRSHNGLLRNVILRNNLAGDFLVIVVFGEDHPDSIQLLMSGLRDAFPAIQSLYYTVNTKPNDSINDLELHHFSGSRVIIETIGGLKFRIGPVSFFQTNTAQTSRLYEITRQFCNLSGHEVVYDLYSGTGTIACYVAGMAKKVVGVEYVEDAVADARINASLNQIGNASFFAGDMARVLTEDFFAANGHPDVIITDPPRAGMHPLVVEQILKAAPARIVYVSCNPATQARDVTLLSEAYEVKAVQPVDMFPHTSHVENVMLLGRKT